MEVWVNHFVRKNNYNSDVEYDENRRPVTKWTKCSLPLKFGYGSCNEPKRVCYTGINADDVIEISDKAPE